MSTWADLYGPHINDRNVSSSAIVITTTLAFVSGFVFGAYSVRGYLWISPALVEERRRNNTDPVESDASDVDDDVILDHAPNWANGEEADMRDGLRAAAGRTSKKAKGGKPGKDGKDGKDEKSETLATSSSSSWGSISESGGGGDGGGKTSNEECKLVLVVRTDLGMTKGKIAAQCGHATLACYKSLLRTAGRDQSSPAARLLQRWERNGQAKIALQAKGEDALLTLMGTAHSLGVTAEVIADAGRTQIDPGSLTVLGVGPAPKSLVDKVTGHLKLL